MARSQSVQDISLGNLARLGHFERVCPLFDINVMCPYSARFMGKLKSTGEQGNQGHKPCPNLEHIHKDICTRCQLEGGGGITTKDTLLSKQGQL